MADNNADNRQQERNKDRVRVLKHNLEGWREALLPVNSLLMWERPYDPGLLVGAVVLVFSNLWYFDPSVLTTFSVLGIVACVIDYLVPTLSASFFDPEKWTAAKERKYEDICKGIVKTWDYIESFHTTMSHLKENKPKIYFIVVLSILVFFAWLGNLMDNLLLTFLLVCFAVLLPGLKHHGILKQYLARLAVAVSQAIGIKKQKKN